MLGTSWSIAAPAIGAAFLASIVEVVEAFTIILAVGVLRGWRPALAGTFAALAVLAVVVLALGPLLDRVPLHSLQLVIGILLLLFGLGWLRKAILRSAGIIPLHDEMAAFRKEQANLTDAAIRHEKSLDWLAGMTAFKGMLLEGLEVIFIVIAVGSGRGLTGAASLGALAACVLVFLVGLVIHKPLSRVPENTLKFAVAIMLSSFGVFWTGEGLGVEWPGADLMLFVFAALFLGTGLIMAAVLGQKSKGVCQMNVLGDVLKELASMFVADARLTLAILILVAAVATMPRVLPGINPLIGGWILLSGCLAIIVVVTTLHARHVRSKEKS